MATSDPPISAFAAQRARREHLASLKPAVCTNGDENPVTIQDFQPGNYRNSPSAEAHSDESDIEDSLVPEVVTLPGELVHSPSDDPRTGDHITLQQDEYMTIIGSYEIEVLSGVLILSGTTLYPTSGRQSVSTLNSSHALCCLIGPAKIVLYNSQNGRLQSLKLFSPLFSKFGGVPISHYPTGRTYAKVALPTAAAEIKKNEDRFLVELSSLSGKPGLHFAMHQIPRTWMNEIRRRYEPQVENSSRILQILGSPRAGSVTFSTMIVNSFLARRRDPGDMRSFALIDLNFYAPLFGPPGQLSLTLLRSALFSSAFTKSISSPDFNIVKAHAIGVDGYQENAEHFLACLKDLIQTFEHLQNSTDVTVRQLLIYCPTSRAGFDFEKALRVRSLINEHISLADVETIAIGVPDQYIQAFNESQFNIRQLDPDLSAPRFSDFSSAQRQEMQLISYFHASLSSTGLIKWDEKPIQDHPPFTISWDSSDQDFAGIFIFSEVPEMYPSMLSTLLAGSLVQIVVINGVHANDLTRLKILRGEEDDIPFFPNNEKHYTDPFDPKTSECVGVALVRRIDRKRKLMWLVTSISASVLATLPPDKTLLAFGAFDTPRWAYAEKIQFQGGQEANQEVEPFGLEANLPSISPNILCRLELDEMMVSQLAVTKSNAKQSLEAKIKEIGDDRVRRIMNTTTPRRLKP